METVAFCEIDPYCRKVLNKHWPSIPIHEDITELDGEQYRGTVDVVCGGWPCQTHSSAAHGNNPHPDMWPQLKRLIRSVRPKWVIAENVSRAPDIRSLLADCGYHASRWRFRLPFRGHVRDRYYFVAHADSNCESLRAVDEEMALILKDAGFYWDAYPRTVGMDDGLPRKMDRLRGLGNAVVPALVQVIGEAILGAGNDYC